MHLFKMASDDGEEDDQTSVVNNFYNVTVSVHVLNDLQQPSLKGNNFALSNF